MIVVFDLDGTLVDASKLHAHILSEVMEVDVKPEDVYKSSSLGFLVMRNLPKGKWDSIKDITRRHEAEMLDRVELIEPTPGVYEMLEAIPFRKAIFTSGDRELTEAMLEYCHMAGYFDIIVTEDDVANGKPDSEGLFHITDELDDDELVVVGNSEKDLLAAKKYGAPFIYFSPSGQDLASADYIVSDLKEIPAMVRSLD